MTKRANCEHSKYPLQHATNKDACDYCGKAVEAVEEEVVRIHSVYHTLSTQKKTELLIALNKWVADEMSKLPK